MIIQSICIPKMWQIFFERNGVNQDGLAVDGRNQQIAYYLWKNSHEIMCKCHGAHSLFDLILVDLSGCRCNLWHAQKKPLRRMEFRYVIALLSALWKIHCFNRNYRESLAHFTRKILEFISHFWWSIESTK